MQRLNTHRNLSYPDVLGLLSQGVRLNTEAIQAAVGVYPHSAAVGQTFEILLLLQNTVDQNVPISVNVQVARRDGQGNRASFFVAQDTIQIPVGPGEVGLLHIPVTPQPPTLPSSYSFAVTLEGKKPRGKTIRDLHGGRVPGILPISPTRLSILRNEVGFSANMRVTNTQPLNTLIGHFEIVPGVIMGNTGSQTPRYETLWTPANLTADQEKYAVIEARTLQFSNSLTRTKVYEPLIDETEHRFIQVGFPLLPGEVIAIAKLLTYTMDDGMELEQGFELTEARWFQRLAGVIDDPQTLDDTQKLVSFLYTAAIFDGVRIGFHMVSRTIKDNLGSPSEQAAQASRVVDALEHGLPMNLALVYLPMVMAGLMLHAQIRSRDEDLWATLEQIRVAWRTRSISGLSQPPVVPKWIDSFEQTAEEFLIRSRIPRS